MHANKSQRQQEVEDQRESIRLKKTSKIAKHQNSSQVIFQKLVLVCACRLPVRQNPLKIRGLQGKVL